MAKRQVQQAPLALPQQLYTYTKQPTDVRDELIRIIPSQTSPLLVTGDGTKLTIDFPKNKSIRMAKLLFECQVTPSFTSTSGSDTFSSLLPQFVPLASSIIKRWTFFVGSTVFCDNYENALRWNMQYLLRANPITRLNDTYFYPTGLAPATSVPTTVQFPLVYDPNDFGNMHCGVFPLGNLPRTKFDLYFTPANACMFYTGTAVGTVSLNYTVSGAQFWVEECASALIAASVVQQGLNFSYTEWYYPGAYPITPNAQAVTVPLPTRFRWASKILAVVRKTADITNQTLGTKFQIFTGDITEVTKANVRFNSQLRYQENLVGSLQLVQELKKNFPSVEECDYFQNVTTNGTTHSVYGIRLGNCISPEVESGVNMSSLAAAATLEITWTSALGNNNYQMDIFILHSRYIGISARGGVDIQD